MVFETTSPSEPPWPRARRAQVVGTGLIGTSVALALRGQGWSVTGMDRDQGAAVQARRLGALDDLGEDPAAELVVVATPASSVVALARSALERSECPDDVVVTDVASVKAEIAASVDDRRFVPGHPMAGSEQEGAAGADPELFVGATWVLTPGAHTDAVAFRRLAGVVSSLGAEVLAMRPSLHDELVAVVSHVPHLVAAALMTVAAERSESDQALLKLAAGGFRDMTRVAAGSAGIWPDICVANRDAIALALSAVVDRLEAIGRLVGEADREGLRSVLERAREARRNLPRRLAPGSDLVELRVPVADRPGALAEVTGVAGDLGVDIADLEIAHSAEGRSGVLVMIVPAEDAERLRKELADRGLRSSSVRIERSEDRR